MAKWSKDQIYAEIFRRIADGNIREQLRLKEEELAREFNVSRSPIREVLQLLAQDGLIELFPNRGAVAKSLTPDDIEEVYEIRQRLEPLALEHAVPRLSLETLRDFRLKMSNLTTTKDYVLMSDLDRDFHKYIIETSNKKRLINMLNQLLRLLMNFRYQGFHDPAISKRVADEHIALIDTLMLRKTEEAKRLMAEHIDNSKNATLNFLFTKRKTN